MITIVCDSCGKAVSQPVLDISFHNLEGREVCTPCLTKIKLQAEKALAGQRAFHFGPYMESLKSSIRKNCR